jgi:hypothetical protein
VNVSEAGSVSLGVAGSGIVPVSGPPTPSRSPGGMGPRAWSGAGRGPARDDRWETRLRERAELTGKMGAARAAFQRSRGSLRASAAAAGGARRAITPGVPGVGALMSLNVETDNSCSTFDTRTGRVMAVGTRVIVVADTMNPAGGLTAAGYQAIADSFDAKVWPAVTGGFNDPGTPANDGVPADIDGNGRVVAFYTRAVNELAPPSAASYVGGFFTFRDLLSASECPTSNVGEMIYMLAADPDGTVNGNVRPVSTVMEETLGTLAHQLQHLISASRRMYVSNAPELEETWLDEGLSGVAEELMFYQGSALVPGQDLGLAEVADGGVVQDAFFKYQEANFARLRQWLLSPHASGPFQGDDDAAMRGASWAFLRYAVDRLGVSQPAFFSTLMNGEGAGLANLAAALGTGDSIFHCHFYTATSTRTSRRACGALARRLREGTALNADGTSRGRRARSARRRDRRRHAHPGARADPDHRDGPDAPTATFQGYPFYVPGVAGHRPPHPPLDTIDDGGLPRHVIVGGTFTEVDTPPRLLQDLVTAIAQQVPETGTADEKAAMAFHAQPSHASYRPTARRRRSS